MNCLDMVDKHKNLPRPEVYESLLAAVGCFLSLTAIGLLSNLLGEGGGLFLIGSFGASALLVFGLPDSPYAQPRNMIGGQVIAALVGVAVYQMVPEQSVVGGALAVSITIVFMHMTRTVHPPGGATSLIAVIGGTNVHQLGFHYLFLVLVGSLIMLALALGINNLRPAHRHRYPRDWW